MPADDLFPDTPPAAPEASAPAPAAPAVDTAALSSALAAALEQHVAPLGKAMASFGERLDALSRPAAPAPKGPESDSLTRFMDDPDGRIEELAKRTIARTVVPAVKLNLEQTAQDVVTSHQEQVDKEFGKGTWKELFAKEVGEELEGLPLEMQASRRHVLKAVSAVYGRLHMDPDVRTKLEAKRTDVSKANTPTVMSGYGRARPTNTDELNQDENTFLSALGRSGFEVDKASYTQARKLGGSEDSWVKYYASQKKGT
jgi:hypothetical protein